MVSEGSTVTLGLIGNTWESHAQIVVFTLIILCWSIGMYPDSDKWCEWVLAAVKYPLLTVYWYYLP